MKKTQNYFLAKFANCTAGQILGVLTKVDKYRLDTQNRTKTRDLEWTNRELACKKICEILDIEIPKSIHIDEKKTLEFLKARKTEFDAKKSPEGKKPKIEVVSDKKAPVTAGK